MVAFICRYRAAADRDDDQWTGEPGAAVQRALHLAADHREDPVGQRAAQDRLDDLARR